jgi:hypothetical protein
MYWLEIVIRWFRDTPSTVTLGMFGCVCYAHVESSCRDKLDHRSRKGIYLGPSHQHDGVSVLLLDSMKLVVRKDVTYDETQLYKNLHFPLPTHQYTKGYTVVETIECNSDFIGELWWPDRSDVNEFFSGLIYGNTWKHDHNSLCEVCNLGVLRYYVTFLTSQCTPCAW